MMSLVAPQPARVTMVPVLGRAREMASGITSVTGADSCASATSVEVDCCTVTTERVSPGFELMSVVLRVAVVG